MKTRNFITIAILAGLSLSVIGFEYTLAAKEKTIVSPKIGIVSVKEVFDKCAMKTEVKNALDAEGEKKSTELKKLEESVESDISALSKRKQDSEDYMELLRALMIKRAQLDAQKEFFQQEIVVKEIQGREKIYRKILEAITTIAQEKNLDMILNRDDNYLNHPDPNMLARDPADFVRITETHKLLYFNPSLDITADVLVAMNKSN
jgi:Skp family chaperone for outer membrane proteins